MKKYKVTYLDCGEIKSKIIINTDWYNIINTSSSAGIMEQYILKIELNLDVEPHEEY